MARAMQHSATVSVSIEDVDAREALFRATTPGAALPLIGTPQWRLLRRWLTRLVITERLLHAEAVRLGVTADQAPELADVLPDGTARFEVGSIAASALADPEARAVYWYVTEDVDVSEMEVAAYHDRNPRRFAAAVSYVGSRRTGAQTPPLDAVRPAIAAHLRGTARRRAFRQWLETRSAEMTAVGARHSTDPRSPRR
ncbi:MAG: malonyl CoA-ACP transacylase [Mycobacterium sp.]